MSRQLVSGERAGGQGPTHSSDFRNVVARICEGSDDAIWEFIETYGPHLQRYVRRKLNGQSPLRVRFDSQDFVQMVWASFFADRETIARFKTPEDLVGYLVTMIRNKLVSEMRRSQGEKGGDIRRTCSLATLEGESNEPRSKDETPSRVVVAREELQSLLNQETQRDRQIVEQRMLGRTFVEIADELGIDEKTARRVIARTVGRSRG